MTIDALDLKDIRNFPETNDLRQYMGRTSRSVSEAFKDADYACAITKHSPDWRLSVYWLMNRGFHFSASAFLGGVAVGFVYWLTR